MDEYGGVGGKETVAAVATFVAGVVDLSVLLLRKALLV